MKKLTVFLIDDDLDDQEIFSYIISDAYSNIECVFADDGLSALRKMQDVSFVPHIIFIDFNMPRMNGLEILSEIKKNNRLSDTPVYMYSTSKESSMVEACMNLGADGFIKKQTDTDLAKQEFKNIIAQLKL
jgi:CheY-like chemotaxis protein